MLLDKLIGQNIFHVPCIEQGIANAVDAGIDLGVFNGFWHIFDTDDFAGFGSNKVGNGSRTGVKVVDQRRFVGRLSVNRHESELSDNGVKVVGLFGIGLVERFRSHLKPQVFHGFEDVVVAFEHDNILITYGVITFLVVNIE